MVKMNCPIPLLLLHFFYSMVDSSLDCLIYVGHSTYLLEHSKQKWYIPLIASIY